MRNQQSKHDVQGCTIAVAQSRRKDAPTQTTANARMRDSACPKFRTMRNQQSKHDVQGCTIAVAQSRRKDAPIQTTAIRQPRHTFANSTSGVLFLVMGRRDGGVTIPPSWRQKSLQYQKGGHIASKCNNVKACVLPSSHLPLTREARTMVQSKG